MAYTVNGIEVINDQAEFIHESFSQITGTTQSTEAKITASDGAADDRFGYSVSAGSGRIVVGSPYDDDNGDLSGSAYIFDLDGNQIDKITASDGASGDSFGNSVSVGSGRIVVGAPYDDDNGDASGSAYIYSLSENHTTYWEKILDTYKY